MNVQISATTVGGTQVLFCNLNSAFKGILEVTRVNTCVIHPWTKNQKSASFVDPGACSE